MHVRLVPLEGGTPIEIAKDLLLVGRKEDCDIRLEHKSVSKLHCVLVRAEGLLLLRDLGSTNGTRVNGQRVRRAALLPNDQLQLASVRFSVQVAASDPPPSPSEFTQQLDGKEVARLMEKADRPGDLDSDSDMDAPVVRTNALPDAYPEAVPAKS
ncbi:MAG TPA: FHA domain-containing protein [Gemmataceae bacterium]|jgi:pSer/pThr/pTyr-binding forkhead associated (FHA) protein|nr:FHA domain-containing protein [Gemmataceae bacterium]